MPKINYNCKPGMQAKAQQRQCVRQAISPGDDLWWRVREAQPAWEQAGQPEVTSLPSGAHSASRPRGDESALPEMHLLLWEPFLYVLRAGPRTPQHTGAATLQPWLIQGPER